MYFPTASVRLKTNCHQVAVGFETTLQSSSSTASSARIFSIALLMSPASADDGFRSSAVVNAAMACLVGAQLLLQPSGILLDLLTTVLCSMIEQSAVRHSRSVHEAGTVSRAEPDAKMWTDRIQLIEVAVDAAHLEVDTALPRCELLLRIRFASFHDSMRQNPAARSAMRREHESCRAARTRPPLHWAMCPMRLLVQAGSVLKLRIRAAACSAAISKVQGPRRIPQHCQQCVCGVCRLSSPTHYGSVPGPLPCQFESANWKCLITLRAVSSARASCRRPCSSSTAARSKRASGLRASTLMAICGVRNTAEFSCPR